MKATSKIKCFECGSIVPWIESSEDPEDNDICTACFELKYQYCKECNTVHTLDEDCPNGCDDDIDFG